MNIIDKAFLEQSYSAVKQEALFGRWIRISDIEPLYNSLSENVTVKLLGFSEQNRPIYHLKLGSGKRKILVWSQMHGNESTGTKAIFDFLNFIKIHPSNPIVQSILKECTIEVIPMLNPDGAEVYTRVNANKVDLNRDAVARQAKESNLLRQVLDEFKPDFCFNLHDQRTIFGVEGTQNPATLSFLAPSEEETREVTEGRKQTMNVIVVINALLQKLIPNSIGRYTDEFYPTATGDNFQKLGYNTILIEAGHYPNDYNREEVRKLNFYALLQGIYHIAITTNFAEHKDYFKIPNNSKMFFDVIHRTANQKDVAFQYKEEIIDTTLTFRLQKKQQGDLSNHLGHTEIVI